MIARTLKIAVMPKDAAIFDELATIIEIQDDGGGEFLSITQSDSSLAAGEIKIDSNDWPHVRDAIEKMLKECKP